MHTAATYYTVWEGSTFVLHLIQKSQTGLQLDMATAQIQKSCHLDDWAANTPPPPTPHIPPPPHPPAHIQTHTHTPGGKH